MLGLCLVLAAPLRAASEEAWETVAPAGAGFRVDLPAGAVYDESSSLTLAGRILEHRYAVETPAASFWVTWTELPRVALWLARRDGVLGNVRKEVLGREGVQEISWLPVTAGATQGRELRYTLRRGEDDEREGRLRAFLREGTLYVFHGQARPRAGSAALQRFLDSIRFTGHEP